MRLVVYLPEYAEDQEDDCADDGHVEVDYPEPFPLRVETRVTGSASGDFVSRAEIPGKTRRGRKLTLREGHRVYREAMVRVLRWRG